MRYLALDIGNVLCRIDFQLFTKAISKALNISVWEAGHRVNRTQKLRDVGLLTMPEVLAGEFGVQSSVIMDELMRAWNGIVKFDLDVVERLTQIRNRFNGELKIALLSNVGSDHAKLIDEFVDKYPSALNMATKYYSCNVGVRKPQSLYYQSFLQQYPRFEGCVYLDDLPENLIASSYFGFKAVEFALNDDPTSVIMKKMDAIVELLDNSEETKNSRWH